MKRVWKVLSQFFNRSTAPLPPELTDRALADMLIADFEQMPDRNNPDIWMGGDNTSVNGLIEELRRLTPLGLRLVRLRRDAEKR